MDWVWSYSPFVLGSLANRKPYTEYTKIFCSAWFLNWSIYLVYLHICAIVEHLLFLLFGCPWRVPGGTPRELLILNL